MGWIVIMIGTVHFFGKLPSSIQYQQYNFSIFLSVCYIDMLLLMLLFSFPLEDFGPKFGQTIDLSNIRIVIMFGRCHVVVSTSTELPFFVGFREDENG
mmetsp:Transcript_95137/g.266399  ORF Transcript_95137/g.266399 Transcript_95137/m.266399 type:complete len:98 (+) Transcript_95137:398-691(+)